MYKTTTLLVIFVLVAVVPARAPAQGAQGRVACRITENGAPATGTVVIRQGNAQVATGSCGEPVEVAPGSYSVVLRLDGALDRPEQTRNVSVRAGGTETVNADFATGVLQVSIQAGGRRAAGMAVIQQGGRRVGTLGSGVSGHLSAGTYDVVVQYRSEERRFDGVTITRGAQRTLEASF